MKFKFDANQIIVFLVAFLIGIGVTSYLRNGSGGADVMEATENETVTEEITEETEVAEEENADEKEEATTPATSTTKTTTAPAVSTATTTTKTVTGTCSTGLSAYKDSKLNGIVLAWSPCASDNFQFYKLVKSSKNSSPSYPSDPVVYSTSNKNAASFLDKTVAARTTYYYRICVVQRLGAVNCSNVASVTF